MLGKAQAVSNQPYALYGGDMTAGPSALQSKAFQGIGGLTLPSNTTSYNPMQFSSGLPGTSASQPFGVGSTESYMNPYLEQVLQPQHAASGNSEATFCAEATETRRSEELPPKRMTTSEDMRHS
jgi:hypothetical protein